MLNHRLTDELFEIAGRTAISHKRLPVSTYRLQFNRSFTFDDAAKLVPYLHMLGITDCYASPYLKARQGSQHGYDITDHNALNPEIGTDKEYHRFIRQLHRHGMGQILDFVPNHMGMFDNPKWQDVLENGPSSPYARFFDIDWNPPGAGLHQKVLLPILGDRYDNVLESGEFCLTFQQGAFIIRYHGHCLPVDPGTTVILEPCLGQLQHILGTQHQDYIELQSIIRACKDLPEQSETRPGRIIKRQREKELIKRRLWNLYKRSQEVKTAIDQEIKTFNGVAGVSSSFAKIHNLLEKQAYRLSYWASEELNYRRFFDINELIALRMQDPPVFAETHRLVLDLVREGALTGIRIDHIDGLFNPADYLWRLQKAIWLELLRRELKREPRLSHLGYAEIKEKLSEIFEYERKHNPDPASIKPFFIVVEKILSEGETLWETWPIDGTTGYEFMASLNQIFVNRKHERALLEAYRRFTSMNMTFPDIVYRCKKLVMETSLAAEVNSLAHQLNKLPNKTRQYPDLALNSLKGAIREVIACFPVYRTYINAYEDAINEQDKAVINKAISEAKRRNPSIAPALFEFIRDALLLQNPIGTEKQNRIEQCLFVMRFQQFTGPVMAKGVEDTALYIYNPLVSLNEVGGYPQRFGAPVEDFHRQNLRRRKLQPHSLITTSTHDAKRGEDVRARINVISEVPEEWEHALARWSRLNRNKKVQVNGNPVPDGNEEYLIYQTLLGTFPVEQINDEELALYTDKIQKYILKALREAKVHSGWISADTEYEQGVMDFIAAILEPSDNSFLTDFVELNRVAATCGMYNSLSQVVLKIFSPGTPDIYQGNELWTFSLTDPDNRQPVDFTQRTRLLNHLQKRVAASRNLAGLAQMLMQESTNGQIKLYVTWRSLNYRRDNAALFDEGSYIPLKAAGARKEHICAFAFKRGRREIIVAVPRLVAALTHNAEARPLDVEIWGDTDLILPRKLSGKSFRNIFTNETVIVRHREDSAGLLLADVFKVFPVAALESVPH